MDACSAAEVIRFLEEHRRRVGKQTRCHAQVLKLRALLAARRYCEQVRPDFPEHLAGRGCCVSGLGPICRSSIESSGGGKLGLCASRL